ncbi:MAG: ComF family protein [Chloroflexi bacterium]|nr:ComF family protein [Chloroflexota bacterium]
MAAVQKVPRPFCVQCGTPLSGLGMGREEGLCPACRQTPPAFDQARAWALMAGSVRQAVHRLKYRRDWALADVLAVQLLAVVKAHGWEVDAVVPVPLSAARHRERGYNQAALLAFPVALGLGVPYRPHGLRRVRETRSQVGLSRAERWANMQGAFAALPQQWHGQTILLIDDVMTTGATMHAAAKALKEAGARRVFALTVARAVLRSPAFGWGN